MRKDIGINTFSLYHDLTPQQKRDIVARLKALPMFDEITDDRCENAPTYRSDYFTDDGVRIWVSRKKGKSWRLLIAVHPMLVLGDRNVLHYMLSSKDSYHYIFKKVDKLLKDVNIPCSVEKMKFYRVDTAVDLRFDKETDLDEHLRILKKSILLPHHKLASFQKKEHKTKSCKYANKHSYKQYCESTAFLAYDRTAQLDMTDTFPEALVSKRTIRLEAQLRRKGIEKAIGKAGMDKSNVNIIGKLEVLSQAIILQYLAHLQPVEMEHVRYSAAVKMVESVQDKKIRKQMLYLLRKLNKDESITTAMEKLKEEYGLSKNQCEDVLNMFHVIGTNPITLGNSSDTDELPPLYTIINEFFR